MSFSFRDGFLPSLGASASPPGFDAFWLDTGYAQTLAGVWDVKSGSSDIQSSVTSNVIGATTKTFLLAQFKLPGFGSSISNVVSDFPMHDTIAFAISPRIMAKYTGSIVSGGFPLNVRTVCSARIFDNVGAFKYYLGAAPVRGGPSIPLGTLKGIPSGWGLGVNNQIPATTDVLVIEIGFAVWTGLATEWNYTVTFQFGDNHSALDQIWSTTPGNSGFQFEWWTNVTATGGGWKYTKPLAPTLNADRMQAGSVTPGGGSLNEILLG